MDARQWPGYPLLSSPAKYPESPIVIRHSCLDKFSICITACLTAACCFLPASVNGQPISQSNQIWSAEVIRPQGQPVIPLFDGWFPNADGSRTLCFSYFNLNTDQSLDIPVGENNYLSDTSAAVILPTHFDPLPPAYRHRFCAFTVQVPADFRTSDRITWHLSSAGQALSVPGHILPAFVLDEPRSDGRGEIAPLVKFSPDGEAVRGRLGIHKPETLQTRVGSPLTMQAWIEHPEPRVWVGWTHHSGPGTVTFDDAEYQLTLAENPATVSATFSAPGDYIINMQTIKSTADFEFYCCHTNAYIKVTVSQ